MRERGKLARKDSDRALRGEIYQELSRHEERQTTAAYLDELKEAGDSKRIAELADQLDSGAWLHAVSCLLQLDELRTAFTLVSQSADSVNMSAWCRAAVGIGEAALSVDEDAAELEFPDRGLAQEVEQLLIEHSCDTAVVELWLVFAAAEAHLGAARLRRARLGVPGEGTSGAEDPGGSAAGAAAPGAGSRTPAEGGAEAAGTPASSSQGSKVLELASGGSGEGGVDAAVRADASESLRRCFEHISEVEKKVAACQLPAGGMRRWNDVLRCVAKHRQMPSTFQVLDAFERLGVKKNEFTYELVSRAGCLSVARPVTVDSFETMPPAHFPEIVFLGRSNVGKSSLVNAVLHRRKTLAPVAATPGHTTRFHFYTLNERNTMFPQMTVVDVPGLGFAVADEAQVEHWKSTLFTYMEYRGKRLRGIFHLVSAFDFYRAGKLDRLDVDIMKAAQPSGAEYTLVLTKLDMVPKRVDLYAMLEEWLEVNGLSVDRRNIVMSSVLSRVGRDLLWQRLWSCVDPENPRWHGTPDLLSIKSDLEALASSSDSSAAAAAIVERMEGLDGDSWEYAVRVLLQLGELETAWQAVDRRTSDTGGPEAAAFFPQQRAALAVGIAAYAADGTRRLGERILASLVERGNHDAAVELLLEKAAAEARLAALARTRRLAAAGASGTLGQPPADAGAWGSAAGAADAGAWGAEPQARGEGRAGGHEEGDGEQDPDAMFAVALESLRHLLARAEEWQARPWSVDRWNRLVRWIMERRDLSSLLAVLDAMEALAVRQNAETYSHIAAGAVAAVSAGEGTSTLEELAALPTAAPAGPLGAALPEVAFLSSSGAAHNADPLVDALLWPPLRERTGELRAERGEDIRVEGRPRPTGGAIDMLLARQRRSDDPPQLRRLVVNCTPGSQAAIPPFGLLDVPAGASDADDWAKHVVGHLERRPGRFAGVFQVVDAWNFVGFVRKVAPNKDPQMAPRKPRETELETFWFADNSQLQAETAGVAYRYSAELGDTDGRHLLRWGHKVQGFVTEDGEWLRVSGRKWCRKEDQYLPLRSQGVPVLVQAACCECGSTPTAHEREEGQVLQVYCPACWDAWQNRGSGADAEWALRGEELEVQRAALGSLRPGGSYTLVVADAMQLGREPWDNPGKDWAEVMAVSQERERLLTEHLERRAIEVAEEIGNGRVDVRVVLTDKARDGRGTGALWTRLWGCVRAELRGPAP
ncbi:unnamed protein product [Prorocentrum cordatum]|uniref:EngB-type G domain-containing protein n=1 Tax=Prorocentrum cordatum TaxID=2364126 RepID=A0ABN9PW89_9DINO|nr:unnamed protein product [Polarella glacialis]